MSTILNGSKCTSSSNNNNNNPKRFSSAITFKQDCRDECRRGQANNVTGSSRGNDEFLLFIFYFYFVVVYGTSAKSFNNHHKHSLSSYFNWKCTILVKWQPMYLTTIYIYILYILFVSSLYRIVCNSNGCNCMCTLLTSHSVL